MNNNPPKIMLSFFRWYCNPEYREEIEGDLLEKYDHHSKIYGRKKAGFLFSKEVILLFRPSIIRLKNKSINMTLQNRRLTYILAGAAVLLCIPFIAMKFTNEVNWNFFDFLVAGILLFGTGLVLEIILRRIKTKRSKIILSVILFLILFLIWAELAVGIFGSPIAGN